MAAHEGSDYYSNGEREDDPHVEAMKAQKRLFQLRKKRDERLTAIIKESATAMNHLRARVVAYQQDRRTSEIETVASSVIRIIEAVERRKQIEEQMETLVRQMTSTSQEVEKMMKIGFKGREDDIKKAK
ncbi:t-complex 1 [Fusarium heterosporum]|uniref:T-complex 1 n=1 Tax=Fusarium heterosporum TaxID=42747 RepID=A0A8H5T3M5_FUSHE|nr:t-complex 1 [Fusarium heterosporum]